MDRDERIARAAERAEKARRQMREFEEGEIGMAAALGRASLVLTAGEGWPTRAAMLDILAAAAAGTVDLENVTKGMAQAAHDLIARSPTQSGE